MAKKRKRDSYVNFAARLGIGTDNLESRGGYRPVRVLTQNYRQLTDMYCQSWVVGKIVTAIPEDMVRAGIDIQGGLSTEQIERVDRSFTALRVWNALQDNLTWGRLYGGSAALILIDGQDPAEPLRLETITPGSFRGLLVYDRWQLWPDWTSTITQLGPDYGLPVYYTITDPEIYGVVPADAPLQANTRVHHSRLIRAAGLTAPHDRAALEQSWGLSVIERVFDRLQAFDATSEGAASLVNMSYLRTVKLDNFRNLLAGPDALVEPVLRQMDLIRKLQSINGLTVIDAKDDMQTQSYSFSGLDQVLLAFGQQLSGASDIPLTRLFGQSPAGLNSTGDSDIKTYYDGILRQQESQLRWPMQLLLEIESRNIFNAPLPRDVNFTFAPLWQMSDTEKSAIDTADTNAVIAAYSAGLIDEPTALRELQSRGKITGRWDAVTAETIAAAEAGPPRMEGVAPPAKQDSGFDESDHPRDEDGKFANGGGAGGAERESSSPRGENEPCGEFASPNLLKQHLSRHGSETGCLTARQYLAKANALLQRPCGGDIDGFLGKNGQIYRFNRKTTEIATGVPGSHVVTYYLARYDKVKNKPDRVAAQKYFERIKAKLEAKQ